MCVREGVLKNWTGSKTFLCKKSEIGHKVGVNALFVYVYFLLCVDVYTCVV